MHIHLLDKTALNDIDIYYRTNTVPKL